MIDQFEEILRKDLHQFLLSMKEVDERLPECPDVEEKWESIAKAYIPDGIREFQDFPFCLAGLDDVHRYGCGKDVGHGMGDLLEGR